MTNRRVVFAISYEDEKPLTDQRAAAFAALGGDAVRPTWRLYTINPAPGVFDWIGSGVDAMTAAIRSQQSHVGQQLLLMPTIHWAPAWMSGGFPAYEEYIRGCSRWVPGTKIGEIEFDDSKPWCVKPPHLSPKAMYDAGVEIGLHCGRSTWAYVIVNEPDGKLYFPPIGCEDTEGDAVVRLIDEWVEPMTRGILTMDRKAQFVGPEGAGADIVRRCLEYERAKKLHIYDGVSVHGYPPTADPRSVFDLIDETIAMAADTRNERPLMLTENGRVPDMVEFVRECIARDDIALIGIPQKGWWEPGSWEANAPVLNASGRAMRKLIVEHVKGRPVRLHI